VGACSGCLPRFLICCVAWIASPSIMSAIQAVRRETTWRLRSQRDRQRPGRDRRSRSAEDRAASRSGRAARPERRCRAADPSGFCPSISGKRKFDAAGVVLTHGGLLRRCLWGAERQALPCRTHSPFRGGFQWRIPSPPVATFRPALTDAPTAATRSMWHRQDPSRPVLPAATGCGSRAPVAIAPTIPIRTGRRASHTSLVAALTNAYA
jgi:hypothetical protein